MPTTDGQTDTHDEANSLFGNSAKTPARMRYSKMKEEEESYTVVARAFS
jgi:hypothetical protein